MKLNIILYLANLGNEREVRVCIVNNTKEIVTGELEGDDRQGITLDRCQWTHLMWFAQNATKSMHSMQEENSEVNYMQNLGGGIYLQVHSPFRCVTVRKFVSSPYSDPFFFPIRIVQHTMGKKLCPTKDGISLRVLEWNCLTERLQLKSNFLN